MRTRKLLTVSVSPNRHPKQVLIPAFAASIDGPKSNLVILIQIWASVGICQELIIPRGGSLMSPYADDVCVRTVKECSLLGNANKSSALQGTRHLISLP